jgi:hypothetical protein
VLFCIEPERSQARHALGRGFAEGETSDGLPALIRQENLRINPRLAPYTV